MPSLRWSALVCVLLVAAASRAQESAPLSFTEAARKTLASHPQFERFALALRAAQARTVAAALRPSLAIDAEIENIGGGGALQGTDAAEYTLSLTSVMERGNKRAARVDAAERTAQLLSIEQRIEMLDLLAETARRFIAVAVAQDTLIRTQERATQAREIYELIASRVAAARSPRTEQLNAGIERSTADLAVRTARRQLETARFALASQWAAPADAPAVSADLYDLPVPAPFEALSQRLERLPDLERFVAQGALREAQLRVARAQAVADWRWSLGVRHIQGLGDQALVLGVSVPLGVDRRSRPLTEEAELERRQVPLSAAAQRLQLQALLQQQWQLLETARLTERLIHSEQLPLAREALELTGRGYRLGRFPYRELALAQQLRLALEAQRLEAAAQYHLTRIEIERLTGAQLGLLRGIAP